MHLQPTVFEAENASIAFVKQGAQLVGWAPTGSPSRLWVSPDAQWIEGKSVRGGVPICFPWFGVGRTPQPFKHGTVRLDDWDVLEQYECDGDAVVCFTNEDPRWRLLYTVRAGASLRMTLRIENCGDTDLDIEAALHTYLAVDDILRVSLTGLECFTYEDAVPGQEATRVQEGPVVFTQQTDRIYWSDAPVTLIEAGLEPGAYENSEQEMKAAAMAPAGGAANLAGVPAQHSADLASHSAPSELSAQHSANLAAHSAAHPAPPHTAPKRITRISQTGGGATIVWNPWREGAQQMSDFADDGWRSMVCVEAACARQFAPVIKPGQAHELSQLVEQIPVTDFDA